MHFLRKILSAETALVAGRTGFQKTNHYWQIQMNRFSRRMGAYIRQALKKLANGKWPKLYRFGFLPVRSYRIRQMAGLEHFTWWVEKDIPPYDRFQCAAYIVELTHNAQGNLVVNVFSGNHTYPVLDPLKTNLGDVLDKASQDPPAVIPRWWGSADD